VQLRQTRGTVERTSDAVEMDREGSIYGGTVYQTLHLGARVLFDDADKWRSRRDVNAKQPGKTRWYRLLRVNVTDLSGRRIYVKDNAVAETTDPIGLEWEQRALFLEGELGPAVEREVTRICEHLGVERVANPDLGSVEKIIRYFTWLAAIGNNLGRIFGDLNAFVSREIKKHAAAPSQDQLNENSAAGMALDRALVEEINKRLKVLTAVLAADTNEVLESLIDALGGGVHLGPAIAAVQTGSANLTNTLSDYLRLGYRAMQKAMGHNEASWNKALTDALESASGCYAAQAQAIERAQPREEIAAAKVFDPKYATWTPSKSDLSYMDATKDGKELDDKGIAELKPGDVIASSMVNPGYSYRVEKIEGNTIVLKAIRD
jgi:hypothetical protein